MISKKKTYPRGNLTRPIGIWNSRWSSQRKIALKAQAAESTRVHIRVIGNDVCTAQEPVVAPHVGVEADQTGSRSEILRSISNKRHTGHFCRASPKKVSVLKVVGSMVY